MMMRWVIATVGIVALAAVGANYYMPWAQEGAPMERVADAHGVETLSCPADAKPAPLNFTLKDANSTNVTLSSFKGKVILLDFWATWCGPCKIEIPGFVEFQRKYAKDGLQVLGVSVDDKAEQLEPYIKEFKMNYPVLIGLGHDDMQDAFGPLVGIPTTFVISRDGKICATHAGYADRETFEREIKALL